MPQIKVVPAKGLQIFDPELKDRLPEEGRVVNRSPYWDRRIRDKDVVVANQPDPTDAK